MSDNVIEIFVEDTCATCARVVNDVSTFVRGSDVTVRIVRREGDPELFRERNVVICPATYVNGRLVFYGDVSPEALAQHIYGTQHSHTSHHSTSTERIASMNSSLAKSVIAGFVATIAMTVVMLMAPLMGMPEMNIGKMLGGFMGVPAFIGWIGHFVVGIVLAVAYGQFFAARLPGAAWVRGILYGLLPWLMSQVVVNPMMGAGVFASQTPSPVLMVMGSLLGHMVYGAVLGLVYARRGNV
jgi:hypothetical protein